jgi:hypothetical protein
MPWIADVANMYPACCLGFRAVALMGHTHAALSPYSRDWQATSEVIRLSVRQFIRSIAYSVANLVGLAGSDSFGHALVVIESPTMPECSTMARLPGG